MSILAASGHDLVLASRSPRRRELLVRLGLTPRVVPADIDESPHEAENPVHYVERLAREKARVVASRESGVVVVAADTTIDLDGTIVGQPTDDSDARRILRMLSGRTHRVHTAVAVVDGQRGIDEMSAVVVTSLVTFHSLSEALVDWYVGTGETVGKAGAYAIQGLGAALVAGVRGSLSNVVGLPVRETASLLGLGGADGSVDVSGPQTHPGR